MSRDDVLRRLAEVSRENAGRGLVLHQTIADHFGLGPTDLKSLDLARTEPDLTAGRLAEVTGLSSSAVTSVLDRLEKAGFIERVRGSADRRKVHIRSTGRHEAAVNALFARVAATFDRIAADYDDEQLELIIEVLCRFNQAALELTRSLRRETSVEA
jgi:DNA-binding MarR family transcriptional regulator